MQFVFSAILNRKCKTALSKVIKKPDTAILYSILLFLVFHYIIIAFNDSSNNDLSINKIYIFIVYHMFVYFIRPITGRINFI